VFLYIPFSLLSVSFIHWNWFLRQHAFLDDEYEYTKDIISEGEKST
jgi:hypothetical protein